MEYAQELCAVFDTIKKDVCILRVETEMDGQTILLHPNCRLVTAEITYHIPDFLDLLSVLILQKHDIVPELPVLKALLRFWDEEIEGPIERVRVTWPGLVVPRTVIYADREFTLH